MPPALRSTGDSDASKTLTEADVLIAASTARSPINSGARQILVRLL
jgi:hypothetical protein